VCVCVSTFITCSDVRKEEMRLVIVIFMLFRLYIFVHFFELMALQVVCVRYLCSC
jgi:hypothetical protein